MAASTLLVLASLVCGAVEWEQQLSTGSVYISAGDSVSYTNIPAIDHEGKRVQLSFLLRADCSSGFTYGLNVKVNGQVVGGAINRQITRLTNKPLNFPYKQWSGITYTTRRYYRPGSGWVLICKSNYSSSSSKAWLVDPQWSNYILAIEDLVLSGQTNTVEISNGHGSVGAVLQDIVISKTDEPGFGDADPIPPFPDRAPRGTPFDALTLPNAWVDGNGGLSVMLTVGGGLEYYRFDSLFSYPNGGYNLLGSGPSPESQEGGFPYSRQVTIIDATTWQVQAEGQYYSIDRLVKFGCGKIRIKDTITNKGSSPLGLIVKNYLRFDGRSYPHALMGGNPDPSLNDVQKRANPTLFVPLDGAGLGILVEDDLFRQQARFFYDRFIVDGTGVKTVNLAIPGNDSYTLEWSIYAYQDPDGYADYFDFVNFVRRDWDSNFRIDGPYAFVPPSTLVNASDGSIASAVAGSGTYAYVLTSSVQYQSSWWSYFTDFYWGQPSAVFDFFKSQVDASVAKLNSVVPQVKVLHKYHSTLNILDDISNFPDSQVRDPNGNLAYYSGYRELTFPTVANSYGAGMNDMLEYIMDDHACDGIYWDEFPGAGAADSLVIPFTTFNESDGNTVVVNPTTKQIMATGAIINTISEPWTINAVSRIMDYYGGPLLANGEPAVSYFNETKFPRMVETQSYPDRTYETNLYSPLCYTSSSGITIAQTRERLEMGGIPLRVPYGGAIPFMSKLFPITPIEIHRGWILAQERLITKYTGTYSWGYPVSGTLYRYSSSGSLVSVLQSSIPAEGAVITVLSNGLSVFIRDDLGAEPATCEEVWQRGYGMAVDLDRSCQVDWGDFAIFADNWLGVGCDCVVADFNDDNVVDWGDFAIFAASWLACNDPQNMPPCIATW